MAKKNLKDANLDLPLLLANYFTRDASSKEVIVEVYADVDGLVHARVTDAPPPGTQPTPA